MSVNLPPNPSGAPGADLTPGGSAADEAVAAGQTQKTSEPGMDTRGTSLWKDAFIRLRRNPAAIAGFVIVVLFLLMILAVVSFGLVAIAQSMFPLWAYHPAAAGLRVHLSNGLYANALFDRMLGGWTRKRSR